MNVAINRKPRTQADRREDAEARLIKAAIKLIASRGYDGFTLADVGREAGYSRGLAAHYFGHKENLLRQVANTVVQGYRLAVEKQPGGDRGMPALERTLLQYARMTGTRQARAMSILVGEALVRPELADAIKELNTQTIERIRDELSAGVLAGNIRASIDPTHHAMMIFSFMRGLLQFACFDRVVDAMPIVETFLDNLKRSIAQ